MLGGCVGGGVGCLLGEEENGGGVGGGDGPLLGDAVGG